MRALALRGLIRKEALQIRGDRRMIPVLIVVPLLQLIVFGFAANLDVATARVVFLDRDRTPESRALADRVRASDSFDWVGHVVDDATLESAIAAGKAEMAFVVPEGYGRARAAAEPVAVGLVADGTDAILANVGLTAAGGILQQEGGLLSAPVIEPRTRVLYNPALRSRFFLVPGVLGTVLMVVTMIATSMAVVREKELGTLEQLQVTPVSRATILAGKIIPYAVIGLFDSLVIIGLSRLLFRVPLEGSILVLIANVPPFLLCTLGLGLLISTLSKTQQQAMMTASFMVMVPMIYLSGFIFAVESMPKVIQPITELIPLRHFLVIVRGVLLKGTGFAELWPHIAKLWALGIAIFALSVLRFRKRLD